MRELGKRYMALGILAMSLVALVGCEGGGGSGGAVSSNGLYLGGPVSFRISDGVIHSVRFSGIECRVPHPDNPELSICFVQAPGLPSGSIRATGSGFDGEVGGVHLQGTYGLGEAHGIWTFDATCPDGSTCSAQGEWHATLKVQQVFDVPPADTVGPDEGPGDIGPDTYVPPDASQLQEEAAGILARIRESVGVAQATQDSAFNAAAQAHAEYYAINHSSYQGSGLSPHYENPDWQEGYTGADPGERLRYQGASFGGTWGEVMSFSGSPEAAFDGWMDTLYHRIPLVHPNMTVWGFGIASGPACEVADVTYGDAAPPAGPARWPLPDSTGVDRAWQGFESPQPPLPQGESYPSGPVITVTFAKGATPVLDEATLTAPDGSAVPIQVRSPANDSQLGETWAVYAYDPLDRGTRYEVRFVGSRGGAQVDEAWYFTTAP